MQILLAEDCPITSTIVTGLLESHGHAVRAVPGRVQLLKALSSGPPPDVVVTDNSMPERDEGVRVLRHLRGDPDFRDLPVIVHSGDDGDELRDTVEQLGGIFAKKETSCDALLAALQLQ